MSNYILLSSGFYIPSHNSDILNLRSFDDLDDLDIHKNYSLASKYRNYMIENSIPYSLTMKNILLNMFKNSNVDDEIYILLIKHLAYTFSLPATLNDWVKINLLNSNLSMYVKSNLIEILKRSNYYDRYNKSDSEVDTHMKIRFNKVKKYYLFLDSLPYSVKFNIDETKNMNDKDLEKYVKEYESLKRNNEVFSTFDEFLSLISLCPSLLKIFTKLVFT